MATHTSVLAWETPWTEEAGGLHTVYGVTKSWTLFLRPLFSWAWKLLFLGAFLSATKRPRFKAAAVLTKYSLLMGKAIGVGPPDTLWEIPGIMLRPLFRAPWISAYSLGAQDSMPSWHWRQQLKVMSSESQQTSLSVFLQPINKIRISEVWTSQGYSFLNHSGKDKHTVKRQVVYDEKNFLMPKNSHFNSQRHYTQVL